MPPAAASSDSIPIPSAPRWPVRMPLHSRDDVTGIILGKFDLPEMNNEIEAFLNDYFKDYDKPVVCNIDFGHVFPILTLPIGRDANLECTDKKIKIELEERK